ncbi:MAG: hypothetical protein ABSB35_42645 [Bryobacteraceae bacterium]
MNSSSVDSGAVWHALVRHLLSIMSIEGRAAQTGRQSGGDERQGNAATGVRAAG